MAEASIDVETEEERRKREYQAFLMEVAHRAACEAMQKKATVVLENARSLSVNLAPKSNMRKLVDVLEAYLKKRIVEDECVLEIERRIDFVEACVNAITMRDQVALDKVLAEEQIKEFKGFITQRLYDIAKPFQFFSAKRRTEIAKGAIALVQVGGAQSKKPILQIVGEYDKGMHCDIDPNAPPEVEEKKDAPAPSPSSSSNCVIS